MDSETSRFSLLVASNDLDLCKSLSKTLQALPVTLSEVGDSKDALDACRTCPPHLLVLDTNLGGLEVLREVRNRNEHVLIFALTNNREEQLDALALGASDVLDKPLDDLLLLARIKRLFDMRRQQCKQEKFLSFLAHDMMQPLGVISVTNDWLVRQPEVTAEAKDAFLDIDTAWKKLKTMIEDMLALSKLAQVDMAMEPESVELSHFLEQLEATHGGPLARNGLVFTSTYENDVSLTLDPKLLVRLAGNIVGNARRYARKNIVVSARDGGDFVELNFCNDGPPIPIESRVSVFEKFTQQTNGCGTLGLGLHFCKLVAELHGGTISVGQTDEWPVVFTVTLPKRAHAMPLEKPTSLWRNQRTVRASDAGEIGRRQQGD